MGVREVAERYFACVSAHDAEGLANLFAEDGWLRPPPPVTDHVQGRTAIRAFYQQLFEWVPDVSIERYQLIVDGNTCAAPFSSWINGELNPNVIDVFTVNDRDELVEMIAYTRAPAAPE